MIGPRSFKVHFHFLDKRCQARSSPGAPSPALGTITVCVCACALVLFRVGFQQQCPCRNFSPPWFSKFGQNFQVFAIFRSCLNLFSCDGFDMRSAGDPDSLFSKFTGSQNLQVSCQPKVGWPAQGVHCCVQCQPHGTARFLGDTMLCVERLRHVEIFVLSANHASTVSAQNSLSLSDEQIRASILSAVEDKMRRRLKDIFAQASAEMTALNRTQEDLQKGKATLDEMLQKLEREQVGEFDLLPCTFTGLMFVCDCAATTLCYFRLTWKETSHS